MDRREGRRCGVSDVERNARLRNEIRQLASQIDREANLAAGTTLGAVQTNGWLHELTPARLEAIRDGLLNR
jgi:hypothetical protein